MGTGLLEVYHNKIKQSWKIAFISTFIIGMLVHIYKFTNTLLNHDALFNFYSDQNILGSGRWFLSIACQFSSYFDLPWLIGLFSILLIAFTAVVIADIFSVENPVMLVLIGGLLVTFPAITQTFFFEFTADGYMVAMLLAALTVRFSLIGDKHIHHIFIAMGCICLCCAIYQAYVSFALVLALCYFIGAVLENSYTNKDIVRWVRNQITIYGGLTVYYCIWKLLMCILGYTPTSYEGISAIGQMNMQNIIDAFISSIRSFILVFLEWNIFEHGLTAYSILNILFIGLAFLILFLAVKKSKIYKRKLQLFLMLLAVIAIPFAVFLWYFSSPGVAYSMRMEQSVCVLYIFAGVLFCRWANELSGNVAAIVLMMIILNNGVNANIFYYHMDRCNERSYATAVEMSTRMHLLDDGKVKNIAVIGEMDRFDDEYTFTPEGLRQLGGLKIVDRNLLSSEYDIALYLSNVLDFQLSYYNTHPNIVIEKREQDPVSNGWKLQFPLCDLETKTELIQSDTMRKMECWPAADSVQVMNDTIVIKLSEVEPTEGAIIR